MRAHLPQVSGATQRIRVGGGEAPAAARRALRVVVQPRARDGTAQPAQRQHDGDAVAPRARVADVHVVATGHTGQLCRPSGSGAELRRRTDVFAVGRLRSELTEHGEPQRRPSELCSADEELLTRYPLQYSQAAARLGHANRSAARRVPSRRGSEAVSRVGGEEGEQQCAEGRRRHCCGGFGQGGLCPMAHERIPRIKIDFEYEEELV